MDDSKGRMASKPPDNQAWRKKPRKFAPKSRLGCKTCKIRRIKCDLSQPSCLKCKSTGRTCDSYHNTAPIVTLSSQSETTTTTMSITDNSSIISPRHAMDAYSTLRSATGQRAWHQNSNYTAFHTALPPLMVLPATDPGQAEALSFFQAVSSQDLNQYQPGDSWQLTLLYFAQTVPAVRHAAVALALIQQTSLNREVGWGSRQPAENGMHNAAALTYYNKAIQLLLGQDGIGSHGGEGDGEDETRTAITLLVCLLFTCFEHVAGRDVQALAHLRGGVQLARTMHSNGDGGGHGRVRRRRRGGGAGQLVDQVTRQIRRLDWQAATFLVDWAPAAIMQDDDDDVLAPPARPISSVGAHTSLGEAADALQPLIARVMMLRNAAQRVHPVEKMAPADQVSLKHDILGALDSWSTSFEAMQAHNGLLDAKSQRLVSLLRLQHSIAWILLSAFGPEQEMEYDRLLPHFQRCVALAEHVASGQHGGVMPPSSSSTFTPDLGIVPVLYTIGVKCRHPAVRRDVVRILKRATVREALWHGPTAARVVERVMDIEQRGSGEYVPRSMDAVFATQRVEDVSWIQVGDGGGSVASLDLQYTLCGQEGVHTETVVL